MLTLRFRENLKTNLTLDQSANANEFRHTPTKVGVSASLRHLSMHILFRGGFLFKFGMGGGRGRVSLKRETCEIQNTNTLSRALSHFCFMVVTQRF